MRTVAVFAFLLLVLALALDLDAWSRRTALEERETANRTTAHSIHIFSTGWKMEPLRLGQSRVFRALFVDDEKYATGERNPGLRLVTIPPDGGEPFIDNYNLANEAADADRLLAYLGEVPVDTVLAMGAQITIGPRQSAPEEHRATLDKIFAVLGSKTQPQRTRYCSFAYLCVRRPQGFVPIAESYSESRGVHIPFLLEADLSVYDDREVFALIDDRRLFPLDLAAVAGEGVRFQQQHTLGKRQYPSLVAMVTAEEPARMHWDMRKNGHPLRSTMPLIFEARLGLTYSPDREAKGVRFRLRVNGEPQGETVLLNIGSVVGQWHAWEVRFDPSIQEVESIALEVEQLGEPGPRSLRVSVGQPTVSVGTTSSL